MNMHTMFALLSDPTRLHIIELLRDSELSVQQLIDHIKVSQPLISAHLRTLREAGMVKREVRAQQRIYSLESESLQQFDEWIATFRPLWNKRLDAMEAYSKQLSEEDHA